MVDGENTTVCQWAVDGHLRPEKEIIEKGQIFLELKPLVAFRDYHHLRRNAENFETNFEIGETVVSIRPDSALPALFFHHNAEKIEKTSHWYRDLEYAIEKERGFDFRENLFQPCAFTFDLAETAIVMVSTLADEIREPLHLETAEHRRRENLILKADVKDDFAAQLVLAGDQFIVSRGRGKTVIAGYPWFSDWGRDTMIALPGLTLATNRTEIAKQILLEFAQHLSEGMLPNRFPRFRQ
jgi:predicted glycogen debranching enzyme